MVMKYRAQDMNGKIYDYDRGPITEMMFNSWNSNGVIEFIEKGKENPNWKNSCFDLSKGEPVIVDGILCAPRSVKITEEMFKTNCTHEQFKDHLEKSSCLGIERKHSHYFKDVSKLDYIDVYRIIDLYKITDPCDQHALKKLLVPGGRGHKDVMQDTQDVIDTMQRKLEMMKELLNNN